MQFFNLNKKNHLRTELCVVELYTAISSFYFNLRKVVLHLDQERKLHAMNCVVFFFCLLCYPLVFELHLCHIGLGTTCVDKFAMKIVEVRIIKE